MIPLEEVTPEKRVKAFIPRCGLSFAAAVLQARPMKWIVLVALAGLLAAAPFLTSRALGTSEAYNYSLAVADAVQQERAGIWPALAGQTEYAFNSRIHPVRTAPYLTAFAGVLDVLTFRQLSFWALQNLAVALSLFAGALTCYRSLRAATPAGPEAAAWLAAAYALSPGVLAPAYTMDLYMTVMVVPFVPLVLAGNLRQFERRSFPGMAGLAAALAACWLAHPPVAVWLCLATAVIQAVGLGRRRPAWGDVPVVLGAAAVFLLLAAFGLASALTISTYGDITHVRDTTMMLGDIHRVFPGVLLPVSDQAGQLSDFQLGYFYFACAGAALALGIVRRDGAALTLVGLVAFFLALTVPVPGVTPWLWAHLPTLVINLTNQWPMQRLYLPMTALALFAVALVWRPVSVRTPLQRDLRRLLLLAAVLWTTWQGWHYVHRGLASRQSEAATRRSHLGSNIELTLISYAILGTPGDFSNGVMDPAFHVRLLAGDDLHEAASNWTAPLPPAPDNQRGTFTAYAGESPDVLDLSPGLTLQPGARYRLTFRFLVPPGDALLQMRGPSLARKNILPVSGGKRGFGMLPGLNHSLAVWTSQATPETVALRLVGAGLANGSWRGRPFADFELERVDPSVLPVELKSLLPLRATVRAAAPGFLETPRMFIAGYVATVDGRDTAVRASPEGVLLVGVPAGTHEVEVRYAGPPLVRWTLRLSELGWLGLLVVGVAGWGPAPLRDWIKRRRLAFARSGEPAAGGR